MKKNGATIVGFIAASAMPALQFVVMALADSVQQGDTKLSESALLAAVTFLVFYPYSILFTAVLGVPIYFLSKRLGLVNWWFSSFAGALVGVLLSAIFRSNRHSYVEDFFRFVPIASASAFAFWLIRRRLSSSHVVES